MKKSEIAFVWPFLFFGLFALWLCASLSSCHALVVADKLYYQGSIGKSTSSLEYADSVANIVLKDNKDD